jgi:GDP-D-mannose dehydratase
MPKSKAESFKEVIMAAVEDETENEAMADAAKVATQIYVDQRLVRPAELSTLVEKALDGSGESFRLKFDDGSDLYLSTSGGILTATVSK